MQLSIFCTDDLTVTFTQISAAVAAAVWIIFLWGKMDEDFNFQNHGRPK